MAIVIAHLKNAEDLTEVIVEQVAAQTIRVTFRDTEADEVVGIRVYPHALLEKAMAYARSLNEGVPLKVETKLK